MAKLTFSRASDYGARLEKMQNAFLSRQITEKAVAAGAKIVADKIRNNLDDLSTDNFRPLRDGEVFRGLPESQKKDLQDSFGLTPISRDKNGFVHTKAGFDGYGSHPTKAYPRGLPNALLARAAESGSSVRAKTPFVEPAIKATRKKAVEAMGEVVDDEMKKIF